MLNLNRNDCKLTNVFISKMLFVEKCLFKMKVKRRSIPAVILILIQLISVIRASRIDYTRNSKDYRYSKSAPLIMGNIKEYVYKFEGGNVTFNCAVKNNRIHSRTWIKVIILIRDIFC